MVNIARLQTFSLFFLILVVCVCSNCISAQELVYEVQTDQVILSVNIPHDTDYRVWHSTNPMKIILDLEHVLEHMPSSKTVNDTALKSIRVAQGPGNIGTRIVMDFNYLMPQFDWHFDNNWLTIVVDKIYVQSSIKTISYGVRYGHERRGVAAGPLIVNYLEVRYTDPLVEIKSVLAQEQIFGRELVSDMAVRSQAIAAVNGLFFASDGRPLGILAIDGQLISEPYANRTAIGIKPGKIEMAPVELDGSAIRSDGKRLAISGFNRPRLAEELIIYTPDYGENTRTNIYGTDLIIIDDTVIDKVNGAAAIPRGGVVVSGHGTARDFLNEVEIGDNFEIELKLEPDWLAAGYKYIIGGGPRLVKNKEVCITAELERFQADISNSRAPRTALGVTQDRKLLLVTVNGRKPGISVGVTLKELAELMIELGAVDAMNLDGGGSTTMVIRNQVLNLPSDGVERPVSNALVIITPESRK